MSGNSGSNPEEGERRDFEQTYRLTLRLPTENRIAMNEQPGREVTALVAALKRAYELRNFEIEHYWKRGTYFWGFQLAIFAAYGLLWKEGKLAGSLFDVALALSGLGTLTALANMLSIKGSKFWYENWERHIDMLEEGVEGRLHRIVWLRKGTTSFSVTRVNETLGLCFLLFWAAAACKTAWIYPGFVPQRVKAWFFGYVSNLGAYHVNVARLTVGSAILAVVGLGYRMCRQRTNLSGTIPTQEGEPGPGEFRQAAGFQKARVRAAYVLRHGPIRE